MDLIKLCFLFVLVQICLCADSPPKTNNVFVEAQKVCEVSKKFLSVAIDTSFVFSHDFRRLIDSHVLRNMLRGLHPAHFRIGGTAADLVIFEANPSVKNYYDPNQLAVLDALSWSDEETNCITQERPVLWLSADRWLDLYNLSKEANLDLLFDLNVLLRRPSGKWDTTNAQKFIKFSQQHNLTLDWQLGNEPSSFRHVFGEEVPPEQLARDYAALSKMLKKFPSYRNSKLVGPEINAPRGPKKRQRAILKYLDKFLSKAGKTITAVSWHQYYVNGRNTSIQEFMDPSILDILRREIHDVKEVVIRNMDEHFPVWITETASAYGGGAPNISDRFVSGFMWLDKLGIAASSNISVVAKQSFIGGNYGLINVKSLEPNPTFWISYIYKQIVGPIVLKLKRSDSNPSVRLYAHCARFSSPHYNSIVVFGMNLGAKDYEASIVMKNYSHSTQVEAYILTGVDGQVDSSGVLLNGKELKMLGASLPNLIPLTSTNEVMQFPRQSIAFYRFSGVKAPICGQGM